MSMGHTAQKKRFIDEKIYQKSPYGSDVPSETPSPLPPSQNIWNLLNPTSPKLGTSFMEGS